MSDFIPFSKPCIDENAIADVVACLRSGWIATGPRVETFESGLSDYFDSPYALAFMSATTALHLALVALGVGPGDEVITTPMTFVATLNAIALVGAKPVLVDIDHTYNIDVTKISQAITPRTRVLMPVHFTGLSVDLDPIYALAKKHNLRVLEDTAQAMGATYKNCRLGTMGDISVISFHPTKTMTTGEGGCLITRDGQLSEILKQLRFHGIDRAAFNRFSKTGSQHYDVVRPGYKSNMTDIQAVIGVHQLNQIESFVSRRTEIAHRYLKELAVCTGLQLPTKPQYEQTHAWHLFAVLVRPEICGMDRDTFMQRLRDEYNIGTGLHYNSAHLYRYYQDTFGYKEGDFPMAEHVGKHIVSLPLSPALTHDDQTRVIEAILQLLSA